jgi:hypothetical protein
MASTTTEAVAELAARYADAWNSHDVEAILEMHTPDAVFQVFAGLPEFAGRDAIRAGVAATFEVWQGYRFNARNVYCHDGLVIYQGTISGTLTRRVEFGSIVLEPNGREVEFDAVDVMPIEDGLFTRKDSYIDVVGLEREMAR